MLKHFVRNISILLLLSCLGYIAFYKIFNFWFYHGWEASWLFGLTGGVFSIVNLMKSHGFVSYFNYILFGWNPKGWFFTALIFHILTAFILNVFSSKLLKNNILGFFVATFFLVTTAHHDVVTWGTFESLYAVQTGLFYLILILFHTFRITKKQRYFLFLVVCYVMASMIRESGIIIFPIIFIFDIVFHSFLSHILLFAKQRTWKQIIKLLYPYIILVAITMLYLFIRSTYGGSAHDFIDDRVQFRILLLREKRYLEYLWFGILSFGQFIGPYLIPYPVLNTFRDIIIKFIPNYYILTYFFSAFGYLVYGSIVYSVYYFRKTAFAKILQVSLLALTIITTFYSFAWTTKISFLQSHYQWSENRWRYFGFSWFSIIFICSLLLLIQQKINHQWQKGSRFLYWIAGSCILFMTSINIFFLYKIQDRMYLENHYPSKRFYETIKSAAPNLDYDSKIYIYRGSHLINDLFSELIDMRHAVYPNMKRPNRDWIRSQMYYMVKNYSEGVFDPNKMYFFDFSLEKGVQNHTEEILHLIQSSKQTELLPEFSVNDIEGKRILQANVSFPVELPFAFDMSVSTQMNNKIQPSGARMQLMDNLEQITKDYIRHGDSLRISVCKTLSDPMENEHFEFLSPKHLMDGNIQKRSYWQADCRPAWIVYEFPEPQMLYGVLWITVTYPDGFPRQYSYEVSDDGKNWETIKSYKENTDSERIDLFEKPRKAKYFKMYVDETNGRALTMLHELKVLTTDGNSLKEHYGNSVQNLFEDLNNSGDSSPATQDETQNNSVYWMKVTWDTDPDNNILLQDRTYYVPLIYASKILHTRFIIPENEHYSGQNQFLNRKITKITLAFPKTIKPVVSSFMYSPLFPYEN